MSMTDLFGSDVDESEEEEDKSENTSVKEQAVSSESERSDQEDVEDNEEDEEDREGDEGDEEDKEEREENDDGAGEEGEEEEEEGTGEIEHKAVDSDEESNNNEDDEENEQKDEEEETVDNHVDDEEEQEQESEKEEEPSRSHMNVSSLDLFGEDLSSDEDEVAQDKEEDRPEQSAISEQENTENDRHDFLGSDGEEIEEEKPEETKISIEIPYSKFSLGSDISFVKLPNFLSVETKPFIPAHYEDEIEEDDVLDEEGRARMKLRVENTIRWRRVKDEDGNEVKESNARIVTWSDGTMSLLLGGEVFDIHKTKIDGEHNHLFVQQGTGLQAQAIFHEKLTFRPHSTNSQTHRKMTLSIADRVSKTGKIKILPVVGKDPESQKGELIKKEEEKLRTQLRRENQQRRMRERSNARGLTASYLEPDRYDDEEDALEQSLLEMKRQYKKGLVKARLGDVYSDQESEDGIVGGLESDDEESGETSADKKTSDDTSRSRKHSFEEIVPTKKRRKVIESDDEESD